MRFFALKVQQLIVVLLVFKINQIFSNKLITTANNKQYYIENELKVK